MTTFSDAVSTTSGTTAGAFGTVQNLTVAKVDSRIQFIGLTIAGVDTVITTAEGSQVIVAVNSPSLQLADQRFGTGPYITSGPATNSSGQVMNQEITPINWIAGGNEIISFSTAVSATNTTGKLNNICAMYSDTNMPPSDWRYDYPSASPSRGGYVSSAIQATTTRTALTASPCQRGCRSSSHTRHRCSRPARSSRPSQSSACSTSPRPSPTSLP